MNINYSYLQDELALTEIRKHKWIESEKQGREIGFATAALDWVKNYGTDWRKSRQDLQKTQNIFLERRRFRRFACHFPISIKSIEKFISGTTADINIMGCSFLTTCLLNENTPVQVAINFDSKRARASASQFQFNSKIAHVVPYSTNAAGSLYKIFLPFSEKIRDFLRAHADSFND